jgi:hypothetical protein
VLSPFYAEHVHGGESPRLLAARSERGYVERVAEALRAEPEAISELEQQRQTLHARDRWRREQEQLWRRASSEISDALSTFVASARPSPQTLADVRAISRATDRVNRHLGMQEGSARPFGSTRGCERRESNVGGGSVVAS